ncbi:integrase [Microbacterium phage Zeta1847]|uniref:Integrase n=1 Tax=Microbacterium phage Zeta1847 TaxID=2201444 RepID=A0A2Z4Q9D7_9CAUD|nr:integrase [Microbacterium phage Zeta1847]AWY06686.1 integrase [Microbacterium phage Zeta1847]
MGCRSCRLLRMSTPASPPRAVLYLRLSREDDASTSIVRQRAELEELAEREGWLIERELVDDGLTGRKQRANAVEALRMLRDGEADALVVWKFDRWSRQGLRAVADLVETLDERPDALFVAHRDGLRSSSPAWRIIASVLAEVARMESENTSTRIRSSQRHLREAGRFRGMVVPFGYRATANPDGPGRVLVHDELEAPLIRDIARRVLEDGATLTELTRELRDRGIPTGKSPARKARQAGKPHADLERGLWHLSALRTLLRNETLLGRTTHVVDGRRVAYTDEHGLPVTLWPPILDVATVQALRERLPEHGGKIGARTATRRAARLLSGVAWCECGAKLYVHRSGRAPYYRCSSKSFDIDAPCPAPRILAEPLEAHVADAYLAVAGAWPELEEVRVVSNPETDAELADIETALAEATTALLSDGADDVAILARIGALKARRRELADRPASAHVELRPTGRTMAEAWHAADPETADGLRKRRDLVLAALDHVELRPGAHKTHPGPIEERVRLHWHPPLELAA